MTFTAADRARITHKVIHDQESWRGMRGGLRCEVWLLSEREQGSQVQWRLSVPGDTKTGSAGTVYDALQAMERASRPER